MIPKEVLQNTISAMSIFDKNVNEESEMLNTIILNIPHSSSAIKDVSKFSSEENLNIDIEHLTDFATDRIFGEIPYIKDSNKQIATFSRCECDVERFANDVEEPMHSIGKGFYYTRNIYDAPYRNGDNFLDKLRIHKEYYLKYHNEISTMVSAILKEGISSAKIIDCHSFLDFNLPIDVDKNLNRPDICLGTDEYHTPAYMIEYFKNSFEALGYSIKINSPFSGTFVPAEYYKKDKRVESIMIEINKKLYMDIEHQCNDGINSIVSQSINEEKLSVLQKNINKIFAFEIS